MAHTDYVIKYILFAWFPVKTDKGWVWLDYVRKTVDERPLVYIGLLEEITYEKLT